MSGFVTRPLDAPLANDADAFAAGAFERNDPLDLTHQLMRAGSYAVREGGEVTPEGITVQAPEPSIAAPDLEKRWGVTGSTPGLSLHFSTALPESVARDMNAAKLDEIARAAARARTPTSAGSVLTDLGIGFLDPIGLAAGALPVLGEARMGALLARAGIDVGEGVIGRTALRAGAGVASGPAAMAPVAGLRLALSRQEQSDYGMYDAARDVAFGSALGGVLHPLLGGAGEIGQRVFGGSAPTPEAQPLLLEPPRLLLEGPRPLVTPETDAAALHAATSAVLDDRAVDVSPVVAAAQEMRGIPQAEREAHWFDLAQDEEALHHEIAGLGAPAPEVDAATEARIDAARTELARPDVPQARRVALQDELRLLTEGAQPSDPAAQWLEAARTEAQRQGLTAALERTQGRMRDVEAGLYVSDDASLRAADDAAKAPPMTDAEAVLAQEAKHTPQVLAREPELAGTSGEAGQPEGRPGNREPAPAPAPTLAETMRPELDAARAAGLLHPDDEAELAEADRAAALADGDARAEQAAAQCMIGAAI